MIDLLVAGAGPAGAATAIRAALCGLSVVVVEPRSAPIDKACGEGIAHSACGYLDRLGVRLSGRPFYGIRYLDAQHQVDARFDAGPGLGVRRTALHASLIDRLAELEVPVLDRRVGAITQNTSSVTAAGITARYLAAADGLHSGIRRQLGLNAGAGNRSTGGSAAPRLAAPATSGAAGAVRRGLRQHFSVAPWSDLVEVYWSSLGEAYLTPVADDLVGVAILTSERGTFDSHLEAFPALRQRLRGAPAASSVMGAGPLRQRVSGRVAGRVMLVGDAAGYVDALTGEGIAVALRTSAELVRCVQEDRPEAYEAAWRRVSWECRLLTGSLLWARNSSLLAPRIVPAAALLPGLYGRIVNRLS
ncbi:flavin-dependent dehydrogenase [Kribbella antiqua]|uniref:Flavin-dependent dehydrogenase n=1 Tax=Kribbella antiqua TaxID=2512217 RepID=A0A4R2I709_9ACTN|nr:monooxygenase [Kribbella antiqua]TCO38998.1 flavin-dependent dehydrogenase [Kribbella antiqua]